MDPAAAGRFGGDLRGRDRPQRPVVPGRLDPGRPTSTAPDRVGTRPPPQGCPAVDPSGTGGDRRQGLADADARPGPAGSGSPACRPSRPPLWAAVFATAPPG